MTPEERASLKGDTLNLGDLKRKGIAMSFPEALSQAFQDQLATREPLKLPVLDSLYRKELRERRLDISSCKIWYMDKDTVATDSIGQATCFPWGAITTELRPIGLYATHFLRAEVTVAPTAVMMDLLYTLIASVGIALFILATLYYQWVVIGHTRQALAAREAAVHHAIHDLKSPLNGIYVLLDSLRDTVRNDAEMTHFLRNGMGRIKRMTEMINSMLDATRKPAGSTSPVREELDIEELLMPLEEELRESFPGKRFTLAIDNRMGTSRLLTGRTSLARCLRNLLENALKYSDDGVRITVTLTRRGGQVAIAVADTGWGILKRALRKLGTLFYRVERSDKPARSGYGVGLGSVRAQVRKLGGILRMESEEGKGSVFTLIIQEKR